MAPSTPTTFDLGAYVARSRALDLTGISWDDVPRHPLAAEAVRTLRYMQDIESHTIVYLRELLATRAIDDPDVSTFLACWLYEETFHGLALARFLDAAGHPVGARERPRGQEPLVKRLEATAVAALPRWWPDFCALHMTWGAINELTTLTGYRRLAQVARHPVLAELLERIILDESRHFFFYYRQAELRLRRPGAARVARLIASGDRSAAASARMTRCASSRSTSSPTRRVASRRGRSTRPSADCPASRRYLCSKRGWLGTCRSSPGGARTHRSGARTHQS